MEYVTVHALHVHLCALQVTCSCLHPVQDTIDGILNPTYLPDPPPLSLPLDSDADEGGSNGAPAATGKRGIPFAPPPHPDIINCGPAFRTGNEAIVVVFFLLAKPCKSGVSPLINYNVPFENECTLYLYASCTERLCFNFIAI